MENTNGDRAAFVILDLTACNVVNFENKSFYGQEMLRKLILRENSIVNITGVFEPLKHLEFLDLQLNQIEILKKDSFKGLLHLSVLNLQDNRISEVEDDAFVDLENLQVLQLDRNKIKTLDGDALNGLLAIETLSLSYNLIEAINYDYFSNFTYLQQLNLENNRLKQISEELLEKSTNLKQLDISSNPFETVSSKALTSNSLEELYIRNCSLPIIKNLFANLPNLHNLDLSNNALTDISLDNFSKLKYLTSLNLSRNSISHIDCGNVSIPSLKKLDVSINQLAEFDYVCIIGNLPQLKIINFLKNPLPEYLQIEILEYLYGELFNNTKLGEKSYAMQTNQTINEMNISLKAVYVCFGFVFIAFVVLGLFLFRITIGLRDLDNAVKGSTVPLLQV